MKSIGKTLKTLRENKGITLIEVSENTKTNIDILKAIENGNIDYFKDDLLYINFYIKNYLRYIKEDDYDFQNDLNKVINNYKNSSQNQAVVDDSEVNDFMIKRIQQAGVGQKKIKVKDYSFKSFVFIGTIIVVLLVFFILTNKDNHNNDSIEDEIVNKPKIENTILPSVAPTDLPIIDTDHKLKINIVDHSTYEIVNYTEGQNLEVTIKFGIDTWFKASVNEVSLSTPASKVYTQDEEIKIIETAKKDLKISLHLGKVINNNIYINDDLLVLDEKIINNSNSQVINIILKGE